MGNPFQGMSNEEVVSIMRQQGVADVNLCRWAVYQVFVENETEISKDGISCVYSPKINGVGCAIAVVASEEAHANLTEGYSIDDMFNLAELDLSFFADQVEFFTALQLLHDNVLRYDRDLFAEILLGELSKDEIRERFQHSVIPDMTYVVPRLVWFADNPIKQMEVEEEFDEAPYVSFDAGLLMGWVLLILVYIAIGTLAYSLASWFSNLLFGAPQ